jgi:putative redox protein
MLCWVTFQEDFMVKVTATYLGEKHCDIVHGPSGAEISTDAPKDNNGKGESFSPTDLVAAATASCMLTVMSILAEKEGVVTTGAYATVEKEMAASPRRISRLTVNIHLPEKIEADYRAKLENAAMTCPVKQSLHPDLELPVKFHYSV